MSNVIVIGCGRVGSRLANLFSDDGSNVCVIDRAADRFVRLGSNFNGFTVQGLGFDEDTLLKAGIEECDVLAAVTNLDNTNLMIAEVAEQLFDVPHVIVRLDNPYHEQAYMQLGFDYVCGTSLIAEDIFVKAKSGHANHLDSFGDFEIMRFSLDLSKEERTTIHVSELEKNREIRIIAFERADGSVSAMPTPSSVLYQDDSIVACVHTSMLDSFLNYVK